jgi:tRNA (mo5U34)-methyltransferase
VTPTEAKQATVAAEIAEIDWYHTLELAPGVETAGWFDCRGVLPQVPFPPLEGKRCLDVATFNGFWAFEMERRGAAEVIGVDVLDPKDWDWPLGSSADTIDALADRQARGRGFEIAKHELGSSVERIERSVYELDPAEIGEFDVVYLGSLLLHLRDPVRALERVRSVCRGALVAVENIDIELSVLLPRIPVGRLDGKGRPWWWSVNVAGLVRLFEAGGFEVVEGPRRVFMPPGRGQPLSRRNPRLMLSKEGRGALVTAWKGDPHAALRAVPRSD